VLQRNRRRPTPLLLLLLLQGCAMSGPSVEGGAAATATPDPQTAACQRLAGQWRAQVHGEGVADVQAAAIAGTDWLRVDRTLAHEGGRVADAAALREWVSALGALDDDGRRIELANLSPAARQRLGPDPLARSRACRQMAIRAVLASPAASAALRRAAVVPERYAIGARALGLYPVTSMAFLAGVARLHRDFARTFATPLEALPRKGRLQRYVPPRPRDDATGDAVAGDVEALFTRHAPVWEVDTVDEDDRLGRPAWAAGGVRVDTAAPVVYRHRARAWFHGVPVLQLSYVAWFPARSSAYPGDLLAGKLDGITWRVTLDPAGEVLAYDAMHNCGCYHMFFPSTALRRAPPRLRHEEPLLVPQRIAPGPARVVLRLAHRTHHIQRVYRDSTVISASDARALPAIRYTLDDYDALRSLPGPGGTRRSLFRADGLVAGSERGERFLFWPMGVASAGAMRQWGHHATAFVGRRHFDDPLLLQRYFLPRP
jgi:hypothetical protein